MKKRAILCMAFTVTLSYGIFNPRWSVVASRSSSHCAPGISIGITTVSSDDSRHPGPGVEPTYEYA